MGQCRDDTVTMGGAGPPKYRGMEKLASREFHKLKIVGSSPTSAT